MQKLVFGIAGEMASGKGTITQYLIHEYKASSYRFSDMLRETLKRLYLPHTRENMQKLSMSIRENYGEDVMAKVMMEDVKNDAHNIVIVEGVRRIADIKYLKELPGFKLIYIEANMEKRYERIIKRDENPDDKGKTFEEFQEEHKRESELQIKNLKNYADVIIDNNGELKSLYNQVDKMVKKWNNYPSGI